MSYLTDGCWSPTRPSVFFTTKMDGTLDIWDIMHKQNDPVLSVQVCDEPLHSIRVHDQGHLVAAGSQNGMTTLLDLCSGLSSMERNEKNIVSAIFERETKREKILESKYREMKLKERAKSQQDKDKVEDNKATTDIDYNNQELITQAEKNFFDTIQEEQKRNEQKKARKERRGGGDEDETEDEMNDNEEKQDKGKASPIVEKEEVNGEKGEKDEKSEKDEKGPEGV